VRKQLRSIQKKVRKETFQDLVEAGFIKDLSVNLFDRAVIIFEGGTEKDLQILDHYTSEPENPKVEKNKENDDETTNSKALHKTTSTFLKSLSANITRKQRGNSGDPKTSESS
jgi:hypothetical protein